MEILLILMLGTFIFLLIASIKDLKTLKVPNSLTAWFFGFVICVNFIKAINAWSYWIFFKPVLYMLGFFMVGVYLHKKKIWGFGDTKIVAVVGGVINNLYLSIQFFSVLMIMSMLFYYFLKLRVGEKKANRVIPYVPFIFLAWVAIT